MEKENTRPYYCIIGVIDAYGAIHHLHLRRMDFRDHTFFWPEQTHKKWRFYISDWRLEKSPLSEGDLTEAEINDIHALIEKHYSAWKRNKNRLG